MERARPPGTRHRRFRRRGPRSAEGLLRRVGGLHVNYSIPVLPVSGGPSQSGPLPLSSLCTPFFIFHCNVRGLLFKLTEVNARLKFIPEKPSILCFTETWLNPSSRRLDVAGYTVVSRRDRNDGRSGGGVIIFVASAFIDHVVPIFESPFAERVWCLFHCHLGPLLVSCWYRPPEHGEVSSIDSL